MTNDEVPKSRSKMYVVCSVCGTKLGKYGPGSDHETVCPRCSARLEIVSEHDSMVVKVLAGNASAV